MNELPVSKQYYYTVSKLYEDYLEQRITEQEYNQRLDEVKEEEAKKQEHLGPLLVRQGLESVEKDILETQRIAFEARIEQENLAQNQLKQKEMQEQRDRERKARDERYAKERKEQEARRAQEAEQEAKERERVLFRSVTGSSIIEHNESAMKIQRQYSILQFILLVFSATTATLAGIEGVPRWIVAFTGLVAAIAGGVLTTYKMQDRIYANHKAVAELRLECQKYDYHIDEYKGLSAEEAFISFSRAINIIQGELMLQEVELWNPRREENKKALPDTKGEKHEEKGPEKTQDAETLEEHQPEKLGTDHSESDEKQYEVVPNPLE